MADVTIDLAGLLEEITGLEKIPVGNGSGNPATVTINLILNKVDNKINEEVYTKEEINAMLSTSLYEWVDLGLPSGLKWAAWNVGATKPEEYGLYFAWGETQGYTGITDNKKFSWSDYKWCNGSNTTLTKYNNNSSYGTVDNLSSLTASDDAASAAQSTCRIPTKAEFEELVANTTSTLETLNGINGRRFTSKTNGNSIFIPASGGCSDGSLGNASSNGYCWSSSLYESSSRYSWSLKFNSGNVGMDYFYRYCGRSVRAVLDANVTDIFDPIDYSTREEVDNKIQEVNNKIPTKVSELENDVPYVVDSPKNGLYIYDTDGNFILPANWDTINNSKAMGVAILTDDCRFVVAKEDIGQKAWGGYKTDIASLTNYTSKTEAAKDFAGITNTRVIIDAIGQTNDGYRTGSAAQDCVDYIFPNGQAGYLGAAGEWKLAHSYKDELNSVLELIGGIKMAESYYLTSTEYSSSLAWVQWFDSRSHLGTDYRKNTDNGYVRAFLAIEQPKTVKERISELETQTASFVTEYATKEEFNNKISELETQTEFFVTTNDLSGYVTKEEVNNKISELETSKQKVSELESVLFGKFKDALIECFKNVAWVNEKGNELVEELETSLNIENSNTGSDTDYVKDGLMFWFDGINNTANGHDSDSAYWEDLTGNGFNLYAYSNSNLTTSKEILFNSNHVRLDGSTILAPVGKNGPINNLLANNPGTLEIVFKQLNQETSVIFMTYAAAVDQPNSTKVLWYRNASGGYVYKSAINGAGVAAVTGQFSEVKSFSHVYPDGLTLIDGEVFSETIEGGDLSSLITSISIGGRTHSEDNNGYFAQAEIYAIRYYKRKLTESERLQNFKLDKERFGL